MLRKRKKQYVADEMKNEKYWAKRTKNNSAARKSREAKRLKENQVIPIAKKLQLIRLSFKDHSNAALWSRVAINKKLDFRYFLVSICVEKSG